MAMLWDDFGVSFKGYGPEVTVIDNDGTPNHILRADLGNAVHVDWSFTGGATPGLLSVLTFTVSVYAESVGPGPERRLGTFQVHPGDALHATIAIPAGTLPAGGPSATDPSGVYRLTTIISTTVLSPSGAPVRMPIEGFHDGPTIEMRKL